MQQFTVPQFIDVEDKIIGPITARQFIIMLAGFMVIGVLYKIFDFSAFLTFGVLIFIISVAFSFIKVNGRPFHFFVLNLAQTFKKPYLRTWNHAIGKTEEHYAEKEMKEIKDIITPPKRHYTTSRLAELSLIVDTRGSYKGENNYD